MKCAKCKGLWKGSRELNRCPFCGDRIYTALEKKMIELNGEAVLDGEGTFLTLFEEVDYGEIPKGKQDVLLDDEMMNAGMLEAFTSHAENLYYEKQLLPNKELAEAMLKIAMGLGSGKAEKILTNKTAETEKKKSAHTGLTAGMQYRPGHKITMGTYKDIPVEWVVAETKKLGNKEAVFLVAEKILGMVPYGNSSWNASSVNTYLNDDAFTPIRFTKEEQEQIILRARGKGQVEKMTLLTEEVYDRCIAGSSKVKVQNCMADDLTDKGNISCWLKSEELTLQDQIKTVMVGGKKEMKDAREKAGVRPAMWVLQK